MSQIVVEVNGLRKSYGSVVAVDDISFQVEKGSIFCLVGPNGAGKTTTVECLEGLRHADKGTIRVLGLDPFTNHDELLQRIGVQLQESNLPGRITVQEALELFAACYDNPLDWRDLVKTFDIEGKAKKQYHQLSGGQKRRLQVAMALIGRPALVFLDEPTTGLDPEARYEFWQYLKQYQEQGGTIVVTTHYMEEAQEYCDVILIMDGGKVVAQGSPRKLLHQYGLQTRITIPVNGNSNLNLQGIQALPSVKRVKQSKQKFFVYGGGNDLLPSLLPFIDEVGLSSARLSSREANLEDLYLFIAGREYKET